MTTRWVWAGFAAAVLAAPQAGEAQSLAIRQGSIGLGAFGAYGTIMGDSRLGRDFQNGGGYGVDLRYVVGPHWTMGLIFQNQIYQPESSDTAEDKLVTTGLSFNVYYYRQRGMDVSQYLFLGVGFYRPEVHFVQIVDEQEVEQVSFPGENLALTGGLGVDLFIRENWGINLSGRAIGYFGDGISKEEELAVPPVTATGDVALGLIAQAGLFYYLGK